MSVVPEVRTRHAERHAHALAALHDAERGARSRTTAGSHPSVSAAPVASDADDGTLPPSTRRPPARPRRSVAESTRGESVARPVHPALAPLLPGGALPVGGVLTVQGSTSLLLGLLAAPSRDGAWTALVGAPAVGLLAAADAGMSLGRTVVVPAPGPDAPTALAALLDGMDVVVVGPQAALADADRRRLAARVRQRDAVLVSTVRWPGAHIVLDARGGSWSGVDAGAGWLRRRTLSVLRTGRGAAARPVEIDVEVPLTAPEVGTGSGALAGKRPVTRNARPRLRVA